MLDTPDLTNRIFESLGEQLAAVGESYHLVVIGGSALLALGFVQRPTRDVDVVALLEDGGLVTPEPLPEALVLARERVARDFGLPNSWLNTQARSLLDFGLPEGFADRLERHDFGPSLSAHFASRLDQIHFKLYAMVDQGPGKHEADLRALDPSRSELLAAANWARTHDPSQGFRDELLAALAYLGIEDAGLDA